LRKVAEAVQGILKSNIVPASPVCKQAAVPYSRFVTDDRRKMRAPFW
jgi:hypothetical protein